MNSKRIQLLLTGVAVWICLLTMNTTTYGGSIVIGGNYTDIGTIVIVSPKPGDTPQANGTALLNNLADITVVGNDRYVIKLGPGIYDIGTNSLQMKQYVDIEGSGENTTIITGHIASYHGVVQGANNAEIRFLTVQNVGGGYFATAIYNEDLDGHLGVILLPSTFNMTHVTASASGGTTYNVGIENVSSSTTMTNVTASVGGSAEYNWAIWNEYSPSPKMMNVMASALGGTFVRGIHNNSSSPTMTNMTVSASGGTSSNFGVENDSSSPTMMNVTVSASGADTRGIYCGGAGTVRINHSVINASSGITIGNYGTTTYVGNTQLDGGSSVIAGGTLTCAGVYDGNYTFYPSTCP